jgi:hypothetical protein
MQTEPSERFFVFRRTWENGPSGDARIDECSGKWIGSFAGQGDGTSDSLKGVTRGANLRLNLIRLRPCRDVIAAGSLFMSQAPAYRSCFPAELFVVWGVFAVTAGSVLRALLYH